MSDRIRATRRVGLEHRVGERGRNAFGRGTNGDGRWIGALYVVAEFGDGGPDECGQGRGCGSTPFGGCFGRGHGLGMGLEVGMESFGKGVEETEGMAVRKVNMVYGRAWRSEWNRSGKGSKGPRVWL